MLDVRLAYVIAVNREGSFSAAARAMGVTQPAVTKSLADLEREVGYAIFYRTAGGAIPTEHGTAFIDRAGRLLEDAQDLLHGPPGMRGTFAPTLRVGISPASMEWQIVDAVEVLLKRYEDIRVETFGGHFERVVNSLRSGGIDVAVGLDEAYRGWPDLERKSIGMIESDLFVRKEHPLVGRTELSGSDLAQFDFVSQPESKPYGEIIRGFYEAAGERWRRRMHIVDFFPTAARIVRSTDAIGMVQRAYTRTASFERYYASLDVRSDLFPPSLLCCAYRKHRDLTPAMRAFIAAIRSNDAKRA